MNNSNNSPDQDFHEAESQSELVEARVSKMAILSVMLGVSSSLFFVLTGIPAIALGIFSILRIAGSSGEIKGKIVARAGILVSVLSMYIFFVHWSMDTSPIPNDYSIEDIRSAPVQYARSYEILKALVDEGVDLPDAPGMGLTEADVEIIDQITNVIRKGTREEISRILDYHKKDVEHAWQHAQKARNVIHQLNGLAEIADLTEPEPLSIPVGMRNLVRLVRLYQAYAHLLTEQEEINTFVGQLIELDAVIKKIALNVRPFIGRLTCNVCLMASIETATIITNNLRVSRESVELMAEHFMPLTAEQMSVRNCVLFEYLVTRAFADNFEQTDMKDHHYLFKKNSALRWYRNLYDRVINSDQASDDATIKQFSVWPEIYPFKEPSSFDNTQPLPLLYMLYNPEGSKFIRMFKVPFQSRDIDEGTVAILIKDNLLQIAINKRIGKE